MWRCRPSHPIHPHAPAARLARHVDRIPSPLAVAKNGPRARLACGQPHHCGVARTLGVGGAALGVTDAVIRSARPVADQRLKSRYPGAQSWLQQPPAFLRSTFVRGCEQPTPDLVIAKRLLDHLKRLDSSSSAPLSARMARWLGTESAMTTWISSISKDSVVIASLGEAGVVVDRSRKRTGRAPAGWQCAQGAQRRADIATLV